MMRLTHGSSLRMALVLGPRLFFSLDCNPDCIELYPHVLVATITNCGFRYRHRWYTVLDLWAFGKWLVHSDLFCMGDGYLRRSSSIEPYCLWSNGYLSTETEKSFNLDSCDLDDDAPRSCAFVENGLTDRQGNH